MKKHFFVPINKEIFISKEVFIFSKWACQGLIWKNRVTSDPQIKNTVWINRALPITFRENHELHFSSFCKVLHKK